MKHSRESLKKAFASVKASVEMEGYEVTKEMEELVLLEAMGEISFEEFKKRVFAYANRSKNN